MELWLATSKAGVDLGASKKLAELVDESQGKLTAGADQELAADNKSKSVQVVRDESAPGGPVRSMHLRFKGAYVSAFFDPAGREKMNRIAAQLADATGADLGALYARCEHLPEYHDIGAWFRGATPALASAALVYSMGLFSETRLTNRERGAPPGAADLAAIVAATGKLDKPKIEAAVKGAGGKLAPGAASTVVSFALGGPRNAARASGDLATAAGMGPDAPRPAAAP